MRFPQLFMCSALLFPGSLAATARAENTMPPIDLCRSFADKVAESRAMRHKKELLQLKADIEQQLSALELKTKYLNELASKRDEMRAAVSASLVKIYSNVEPEAAAKQLEKLNVDMISEVLQRLSPKISGEIITAMDVKLASKVVQVMLMKSARADAKAAAP
jgi:flagellar motility protein MotE (MotC chaperone)